MRKLLMVFATGTAWLSGVALSQPAGTPPLKPIAPSAPSLLTTVPLLDVQLQSSRPLTLGEPRQGVFATLRNNSSWAMRFRPDKTVFVLTPDEGNEKGTRRGCGEYPTLTKPDDTLTLAPNDSTTVVWNLNEGNCATKAATPDVSWLDWEQVRAGMYKVILNAQFEIDKGEGKFEVHNVTRVIEARFATALSVVLVWAFFGGVVGRWVQSFVQSADGNFISNIQKADKPREILAWVGSGLMSAVLVVLGTQLAETAFPVKVDASSMVGAFSSGFLLHFAGDKVLTWLKQ